MQSRKTQFIICCGQKCESEAYFVLFEWLYIKMGPSRITVVNGISFATWSRVSSKLSENFSKILKDWYVTDTVIWNYIPIVQLLLQSKSQKEYIPGDICQL